MAAIIPDHRDPTKITHTMPDILRARILAIACGYSDADDLDDLRKDPAFKLACGRLPESGDDLASQPTMSRWENAPDLRTLIRLTYAMVDLWCHGTSCTGVHPKPSRLISTTPPTPCMAINSSHCSTPTTMKPLSFLPIHI